MADRVICDGGARPPDGDILAARVCPGWCSDTEQNTHTHTGLQAKAARGAFPGGWIYVYVWLYCCSACLCAAVSGSYQYRAQTSAQGPQGLHGLERRPVEQYPSFSFLLSIPPSRRLYVLVIPMQLLHPHHVSTVLSSFLQSHSPQTSFFISFFSSLFYHSPFFTSSAVTIPSFPSRAIEFLSPPQCTVQHKAEPA